MSFSDVCTHNMKFFNICICDNILQKINFKQQKEHLSYHKFNKMKGKGFQKTVIVVDRMENRSLLGQ